LAHFDGIHGTAQLSVFRFQPTVASFLSRIPRTQFLSPAQTAAAGLSAIKTPASSAPTYTGIYFDANVAVLGNKVDLQGTMAGNGDFTLTADAQINLGPLTGSAYFVMSDTQAQGFQFTADMDAGFSTEYLRGSGTVDFTFGANVKNGDVTYAARFDLSVQVYCTSLFGWQGADITSAT
jgi:hypothetical protein